MILIGSQLSLFGIFTKYLYKKNYELFYKTNRFFLYFAFLILVLSIFGIYLSINYWIKSNFNFVDYKLLGRYLITSGRCYF